MGTSADNNHPRPLVGAAGKEAIKHAMSLGKPTQAIAEFGASNGLDIPAADAIYGLLDSLGYSRRDIHAAALESAVLAAKNQIQGKTLPPNQHLALLAQIRHYLDIPQLQHLPLLLLAQRPQLIPDDIRQMLLATPALYERCGISVKRELWRQDTGMFKQYMAPLIRAYSESEELLRMSREIVGDSARETTRRRRGSKLLVDITTAIDTDLRLYMQTLGMVREQFIETGNPALGTLRLDLTMALHENGISELTKDDACHKLAWSLDACIASQSIGEQRVREMQRYFDGLDQHHVPYGDIALILSSPYSRHVLAQCALSSLDGNTHHPEVIPGSSELNWSNQMLTMGLYARQLVEEPDDPQIPKVDRKGMRKFHWSLLEFIKESQESDRAAAAQARHASGLGAKRLRLEPNEGARRPAEEDVAMLSSSELARQVLYAFILKRAATLDVAMVNTWLPAIRDTLPSILEVPAAAQQPGNGSNAENPAQPDVPLASRIPAFEIDAFIQSLVTYARENVGFAVAVLNSASQELGQYQNGDVEVSKMKTPLVSLLTAAGRLRHCAHEQLVVLLAACARLLSAEYGGALPETPETPAVASKEGAVYFIFQLCEYAAAHCAVDPAHLTALRGHYDELAAACPRQAFKYRITRANCPHAAKFLSA
ncbi:hypothetical protein GGF46_003412 [Coemansia sp. RSA 552]|nr:hypothetical protein GGF46_003412 [Coemansia sp. RSA 552]